MEYQSNKTKVNWGGLLAFGAVAFGVYALFNDEEEEDTVNYRLRQSRQDSV